MLYDDCSHLPGISARKIKGSGLPPSSTTVSGFGYGTPRTNILELIFKSIFRHFNVIGCLGSQPIAIGQAKEATKSQIRVCGN
jgi:hypothetical protein